MGSGPTSKVAPQRITDGLKHSIKVQITQQAAKNPTTNVAGPSKWECLIKIDEQGDEMSLSNDNNVIFFYWIHI